MSSAARIVLGAALAGAGLLKVGAASGMAESIANYRLVTAPAAHLLALALPWWELLAGLGLCFNLWPRAAGLLSTLLFGTFAVAVSSALLRGLDIDCGCFGTGRSSQAGLGLLGLDLLGLAVSVWLLKQERPPQRGMPPDGGGAGPGP